MNRKRKGFDISDLIFVEFILYGLLGLYPARRAELQESLANKIEKLKGQAALATILVFIALGSSAIVAINSTSTGYVTGIDKHIFAGVEIDVFANTSLEIDENTITLRADNGSAISGATIEYYINETFGGIGSTDLEGRYIFNYQVGDYSIRAVFGGSDLEYLNPSETEKNIILEDALVNKTDDTPPTYTQFGANNTNPMVGESVDFRSLWHDESGLDVWLFGWNGTGVWLNDTYRFISSYDEKTQILTKSGWKYLKDLLYSDEIAVLSGGISWERPLSIKRSLRYFHPDF